MNHAVLSGLRGWRACFMAVMLVLSTALVQVSGGTDRNLAQKTGNDAECAIAKKPIYKLQLFLLCNTSGTGLLASRSTDGGMTWTYPDATDKTIADGDAGQGPLACCDPNLAWTLLNLFLTYLNSAANQVVTLLSTDGGATFSLLNSSPSASVDQPSVVVANTTAGAVVWLIWNQANQMVARGAPVTGLGSVGAFTALQTVPGTTGCSFEILRSRRGELWCGSPVADRWRGPWDPEGQHRHGWAGAKYFGAAIAATTTNVGGFDFIPAQPNRSTDAEAGLAFDRNPTSPHFGCLYLVYTDEATNESNDTNILLRFSDDNGATWSTPLQVNSASTRSQFLPKIASNPLSGNIAVCWLDARNSASNTAAQLFCSFATPSGATPVFFADVPVSDGASVSAGLANPGQVVEDFGDYAGRAYFQGLAHPPGRIRRTAQGTTRMPRATSMRSPTGSVAARRPTRAIPT